MPEYYSLDTQEQVDNFLVHLANRRIRGLATTVCFDTPDSHITRRQQNSLHLWCEQVARTLEEAGFDMTKVMKKDAKIPWTKYSVKEYLYKPILEAMTGKDSTRDLDTVEPSKVADALSRHLVERLGVVLPEWPRHG